MDEAARGTVRFRASRACPARSNASSKTLGRDDAEALSAGSALAEMVGALALSRAVSDRKQSDAILARSKASVFKRLGLGDVQ